MVAKQQRRQPKCKTPGCNNRRWKRDVCRACLNEAERRIEAGEITEARLIQLGVIAPEGQPGRKTASPIVKVLNRKLAKARG
jgi:hypothetical protein